MLQESDDLVMLGVTFDSMMTFEKHLRSVSRAASQRLGILRNSWRVFHDRLFLGRCFLSFVLPVLEFCSAVSGSAANTQLTLLDRAVSGASFLTGDVLSVTLLIVVLWQHCVCSIRSGVTRCTLLLASAGYTRCSGCTSVHFPLAEEPRSTADLVVPCQCACGTILLTLYSME